MSGIENFNFDAFFAAESFLKEQGAIPSNPAQICQDLFGEKRNFTTEEWIKLINHESEILSKSDAIYLLRGWEKSKGATSELSYALVLRKEIFLEEIFTVEEVDTIRKLATYHSEKKDLSNIRVKCVKILKEYL